MPDDERPDDAAIERRLAAAADALKSAESAADLAAVADRLEDLEAAIESTVERGEDREEVETELSALRDRLEDAREPSSSAVRERLETAAGMIAETEFTEEGRASVREAVGDARDQIVAALPEAERESAVAAVADADRNAPCDPVRAAADAVGAVELDPVADAGALEELAGVAERLTECVETAEALADLPVREQLRRQGFYDVLTPERRRDFPPEWNAVKIYGERGEAEPLLQALDLLDSEFMKENILEAIERSAPPAAFEGVHELAQRRNERAVRVLGRIGDDRACETLEEFLGGARSLELTTLRALGAIGSPESTAPVAERLAAEDPAVRSAAARALGMIGDTRAIAPLEGVLADDETPWVRASAAWALRRIGTERALAAAAEYADAPSHLLEREARRARAALE